MRVIVIAAGAVLAALLSGVAAACSCLPEQPWSVDAALSEGAVFAEVEPVAEALGPAEPGAMPQRLYTARVHRAIGIEAGATISIGTAPDGAACGIRLAEDERRWLLLRSADGAGAEYAADLCSQLPLGHVAPAEWDRLAGPDE